MPKRVIIIAILALLVVVFAVLMKSNDSAGPKSVVCRDCNVIIIGVDNMRADRLSALGYERDTTPVLDALAKKGYLFSQAISPSSWTVPSFMSVMTGLYPSVHTVTNKFREFDPNDTSKQILNSLSPDVQTLAEVMKRAGYETGGFTGDAGVSAKFGYARGFDIYTDEIAFGGFDNSEAHALDWLDSLQKEQKFFMFFHGYDLHGQFDTGKTYKNRYAPVGYTGPFKGTKEEEATLREAILTPSGITLTPADVEFWNSLYDSKLRDADDRLRAFLDGMESRGLLDNTIIVVVSDHGEEFYEHKQFDHGQSLYDELVHVPLIFVVPGQPGGVVVPAQVTTMHIGATLLDILGIKDRGFAGSTSLLTYFTDPNAAGSDVYTETDYRDFTHKRSIRTADGWKYILTLESGSEELYNLVDDPREQKNLIADNTIRAEALRIKLRAHLTEVLKFDASAPVRTGCLPVYQGECE